MAGHANLNRLNCLGGDLHAPPGFVTYDDPESTYFRVLYSDYVQGLGGTFLLALDEDYDGTSQDLLNAIIAPP